MLPGTRSGQVPPRVTPVCTTSGAATRRARPLPREGHTYNRFKDLAQSIPTDPKASDVFLDGEIVCLDDQGRSRFYDLMFHRGEPYFYAFDLLWMDGVDLRDMTIVERKATLRDVVPPPYTHLELQERRLAQ